jgi:CRISPR/Cas system CSM-associated protein Csm3 (group 7 of RAMP superfamily)
MSTSAPKAHPFRHVARVVIEFTTPFHVGTGEGGYGADALVVTDANGLPALPGSSLAGALRATFQERVSAAFVAAGAPAAAARKQAEDRTNQIFGHQTNDEGRGSRLSLTWAAIHDRNDQPVEGLWPRTSLTNDPVLNEALGLRIRDHVRLTHRGAAAHQGKFDDSPVAAGHRFTFELELVSHLKDDQDWKDLLATLTSGVLRLGGKSRRGYGAFKVERIRARSFHLGDRQDFADYAAHPAHLEPPKSGPAQAASSPPPPDPTQWPPTLEHFPLPPPSPPPGSVTITLRLKPRGYWMFGGGEDVHAAAGKPADMAPLREERIVWNGSLGRVEDKLLLLPGSAIKGALSHRLAFHRNRLALRFADDCTVAGNCPNDSDGHRVAQSALERITGIHNDAVRDLFGFVAEGQADVSEEQAARGRVLIDDLYWTAAQPSDQLIPHVSIDRFTGGAADSKLFCERPLWQGDFPELKLTILDANRLPLTTRQALQAALADLAQGRLALGAGAGRGLGYFEPKAGAAKPGERSPDDDWFNQDATPLNTPAHASA